MKIIEPKVELWEEDNYISHVAKCARVCYKKETGDDEKTYNHLVENKHISMLRHSTIYAIIPKDCYAYHLIYELQSVNHVYNIKTAGINIKYSSRAGAYLIATNRHFTHENNYIIRDINKYMVSPKEFANASETAWKMMRYTFCVDTQISTSRELNRVSPNNISEQSTRYVYEDGTICRPHWMSKEEANEFNNNHQAGMTTAGRNYINSCIQSFGTYKDLIEINGIHRQDARGVLPLDTATRCVYTYSYEEWLNILNKRLYHNTGRAHPNCVIICQMIEDKLKELGYDF